MAGNNIPTESNLYKTLLASTHSEFWLFRGRINSSGVLFTQSLGSTAIDSQIFYKLKCSGRVQSPEEWKRLNSSIILLRARLQTINDWRYLEDLFVKRDAHALLDQDCLWKDHVITSGNLIIYVTKRRTLALGYST